MKLFWILIAALLVVTGVLIARPDKPARSDSPAETALVATAQTPVPPVPPETPEPRETPAPSQALEIAAAPQAANPTQPIADASPAPTETPATATPADGAPKIESIEDLNALLGLEPSPEPSPAATVDPTPADVTPVPAPVAPTVTTTGVAPSADPLTIAPPTDSASPPTASAAPEPASTQPTAAPAMFKEREVVPARRKPGEEGWTIMDERFPIRGAGSADEPYEVTWDYLVSASETFQPRMGKNRLPERIVMLDGKHVRITGYVAFPIMAAAQNEMLSMRNMWDGCCIGVPPTPYDAIEVRLKDAATGKDRFTSFGTIEGRFSVDPYVKGNWLLGLYLMEEARLTQTKEGTDPTKHGGM